MQIPWALWSEGMLADSEASPGVDASKIDMVSPEGWWIVNPPSVPGARRLRSRTLANVPRIMTSWLPRRDPYELKSFGATPWSIR